MTSNGIKYPLNSFFIYKRDDIVFAELTVKENLVFAGKFKLPRGTPLDDIEKLADDVIADLGLTRVANSMVGDVHRRGVSGGEKKRVNIVSSSHARTRRTYPYGIIKHS